MDFASRLAMNVIVAAVGIPAGAWAYSTGGWSRVAVASVGWLLAGLAFALRDWNKEKVT